MTEIHRLVKKLESGYTPPTTVIGPKVIGTVTSPQSSASSGSTLDTTLSVSADDSKAPPPPPKTAPPLPPRMALPPPPRPGGNSSSGDVDRKKMLDQLTKDNIPTKLIEFSRALSSAQKEKWQKLSRPQKILWMNSGAEPVS